MERNGRWLPLNFNCVPFFLSFFLSFFPFLFSDSTLVVINYSKIRGEHEISLISKVLGLGALNDRLTRPIRTIRL